MAYVILEGGVKITDSTRLLGNGYYGHVGLGHYVANRFSLYHAVTYFGQSFTDGLKLNGKANQYQYYVKAIIPLKKYWQLSPGFHIIYKNVKMTIPVAPPIINGMPGHPPPPPPQSKTKDSTTNNTYYVASLSLRKTIHHFDFIIGSSISSVFGDNQFQHSASISYSPFKQDKLVIGTHTFMHTENSYTSINYAFNPFIVIAPSSKFSLSTSYMINNGGKNVIEGNGYIINNSIDLTTARWSLSATVAVSKKVDFYGLYQYEYKEDLKDKYRYHFNLFSFGIKIKP